MTTAKSTHPLMARVRMFALAGTLALSTVLPTAAPIFADSGTTTHSSPQQATYDPDLEFDVSPEDGIFDIQAVVVAGTGGAPLREQPSLNSSIIDTLDTGTEVDIRIDETDTVYTQDGKTRFWPVGVGGTNGWMDGRNLVSPDEFENGRNTSGTAGVQYRQPFEYSGELVGAQAQVDTNGYHLAMRAQPSAESEIISYLSDGTVLNLRIADVDTVYDAAGTRWWPVSNGGYEGWVSGTFLITPGTASQGALPALPTNPVDAGADPESLQTQSLDESRAETSTSTSDASTTDTSTADTTSSSSSTSTSSTDTEGESARPGQSSQTVPTQPQVDDANYVYSAGDWAVVHTADGGSTGIYSSATASAPTVGSIPNMALVEIMGRAGNGWYEIRWDTMRGYINGNLLTAGTAPRSSSTSDPAPAPTPVPASRTDASSATPDPMAVGDIAKVVSESGAGVNVRSGASQTSNVVDYLRDTTQVEIIDGPKNDGTGQAWYKVKASGIKDGWVRGDLLVQVVATTENTRPASTATSSAGFILPLTEYRFTQDFGCSSLGFYSFDKNWGCSVHDGLDLAVAAGTPILASADGTVVVSGWCNCGLGYYVEIDHGGGIHTLYGHQIEQPPVKVGQKVKQGDVIGHVGSTGLSTGPHVHFMVRKDGVTVDPKHYMPPVRSTF